MQQQDHTTICVGDFVGCGFDCVVSQKVKSVFKSNTYNVVTFGNTRFQIPLHTTLQNLQREGFLQYSGKEQKSDSLESSAKMSANIKAVPSEIDSSAKFSKNVESGNTTYTFYFVVQKGKVTLNFDDRSQFFNNTFFPTIHILNKGNPKFFKKEVYNSIEHFFKSFGTHYISSICIGGMIVANITVNGGSMNTTATLDASISSNVEKLFNAESQASLSNEVKSSLNNYQIEFQVVGGNCGKTWISIEQFMENFDSWRNSVDVIPTLLEKTIQLTDIWTLISPQRNLSTVAGTQNVQYVSFKQMENNGQVKEEDIGTYDQIKWACYDYQENGQVTRDSENSCILF